MTTDALGRILGFYEAVMREKLSHSWALCDRPERGARLRAITALLVELDKITKVSIQATGLGESIIEDIIMGDWKGAKILIPVFRFEREPADFRERYVPLWAHFVELAEAECDLAFKRARGEALDPD